MWLQANALFGPTAEHVSTGHDGGTSGEGQPRSGVWSLFDTRIADLPCLALQAPSMVSHPKGLKFPNHSGRVITCTHQDYMH